jgi:hypothetical protein
LKLASGAEGEPGKPQPPSSTVRGMHPFRFGIMSSWAESGEGWLAFARRV